MPRPYPLRSVFGKRYFVQAEPSADIVGQSEEDREWLWIIPGKYGHVYIFGTDKLGAYIKRSPGSIYGQRLLDVLSAEPHQMGDDEFSVTFDPVDLDAVAEILRLRKRPRLTEEDRAKKAALMVEVRNRTSPPNGDL